MLRYLIEHKNELSGEDAGYFTGELKSLQSNKRLSEKRFRGENELIEGALNAISKAKALIEELEKLLDDFKFYIRSNEEKIPPRARN